MANPKYSKMLDELESAYPGAAEELDAVRGAIEGEEPSEDDSEEPMMEDEDAFGDDPFSAPAPSDDEESAPPGFAPFKRKQ